ncbi:MAG: hypothetical protein H6Q65_1433 [Firmicutes bacterium]|nr:hypothetical protein [Bacillota bacterium]
MKKPIAIALSALLVLAFAVSLVNAAPPAVQAQQTAPQTVSLTDAQKQELVPLYNQMMEIKKQILQKYVADGVMTQADADQRITRMQEHMNYRMQNGFVGGPGMGRGHGMMKPGQGQGNCPGYGNGPMMQQQPVTK